MRRDTEVPSSALHLLPDLRQPLSFLICTRQGMETVCGPGALGFKHPVGRGPKAERRWAWSCQVGGPEQPEDPPPGFLLPAFC